MKRIVVVIIAVFLTLFSTIGYGVWRTRQSSGTALSAATSDTNTEISANQPVSPLASQQPAGMTLGDNTDSSQATSLQSNLGGESSSGSSAPAIPGPESFGQYDKYKDDASALFVDLRIGTGAEAKTGQTVAMVYKGWLTNGKLFDESKTDPKSGKIQAFQFVLGQGGVIVGWEQGIPGMKVGGIRRLVVPPSVGYGPGGHDPIPPNAVMVFDVQLAEVK